MNHLNTRLGVLDSFRSLSETLELAPAVEQLGYHRYWLAEHPPQPSPVLTATLVAQQTMRMRIGTAGILFPFYSPIKAAYDFQLLEAAYPGRIDTGFCAGWAPPSLLPDLLDGRPAQRDPVAYKRRVVTLIQRLRTTPDRVARRAAQDDDNLVWSGASHQTPEIWVHGTGPGSVETAAEHGIYLGFSLFHRQSIDDPALVAAYRARFCSHDATVRPRVAIAVAGICAATTARAAALLAEQSTRFVKPCVVGSPDDWRSALQKLCTAYQPDDIIVLDLCQRYTDRLENYRLIAEALA